MDVDGDWIEVDRDGDGDRNAKWRQEIGMVMERNDRDLKLKKCYICNFSGSGFLICVNFSFLENSEALKYVISIVKIHFPYQNKKTSKTITLQTITIHILSFPIYPHPHFASPFPSLSLTLD